MLHRDANVMSANDRCTCCPRRKVKGAAAELPLKAEEGVSPGDRAFFRRRTASDILMNRVVAPT